MRLAKYLSRAGVASRRRSETIISEGRVAVNSTVVYKPQVQVSDTDLVTVDGKLVSGAEQKVYILLNKPPGYVSTALDTHDRPTVTDLTKAIGARLYPVGRLDLDTSGVLLMTNDGELAHRLMHPRYEVEKNYKAWVTGIPDRQALQHLSNGLFIEGEKTAPAKARILKTEPDKNKTLLELTLTEGKKRQVKNMCLAIGHPVRALRRDSFAGLKAGSLEKGTYRHLDQVEIDALYRLVGLKP